MQFIFQILCVIFFSFASTSLAGNDINEELARYVQYTPGQENHIGRLLINDRQNGISQSTWIYVNAALNHYKKTKPSCIILELNTPGGEVFAAQQISDALKDMDTQYGIPVIAYINNWAISAGAMLAYSCRFIVVAKDGSMGAAEPVLMGQAGEMQSASEKVNSALRTDFANRAKFFGRDGNIAEAMVDKDIILVERHGKVVRLNSEDEIQKGGLSPDIIISPKGKLLTLNADELLKYGVANFLLQPLKHEPLSEKEEVTGTYPLSKSELSQITFFQKLAPCVIDTYQMDWQTKFFAFLALPAITSILFLGLIIGFYVEMTTPGFGFAGMVGLLCLFFIVLSSFAMQAIHWLEPILFIFGLLLLCMEIFAFPTFGLLAVIGVLFMLVGLGGMMLPGITSVEYTGDTLNAAGEYVLSRLGWLSASLLVALLVIAILSRYVTPRLHLMKRFVLGDTQLLATGSHEMKSSSPTPQVTLKTGDEAVVLMTLRPSGKILFKDVELDAISTGSFVEKGKKVRVVGIEGEKIVVEERYE